MPDDLRQELLLPFVSRLPGTGDTLKGERARAQYIAVEITRRVLAELCEDFGRHDFAVACRKAATPKECEAAADGVWDRGRTRYAAALGG